ncbi:hypothetical protein FNV62_36440 [Streptomyces sp. RLB3-17]|uniref:hypothetical protein n=1 Tax=Streptomyces sp. RLB3-17 TaxID=2594455 RepID=UPI0011634D70|nr:hypothetical protein [Streptomyces sp. RLB3-17]QDO42900.1 hypothetical protein FNV62_36440 [Streptomyces sp. RLB3-17]
MFFRRSHRPAVRLIIPRHRSRPQPPLPPLPEDWQPGPVAGAEPDEDEIKVRERLLALLGEVVRWPR